MMEIKLITKNLLLILILTLCEVVPCSPKISDKRLCYDPECSVPVSEAKSLMNYRSNDREILSFPMNIDVKVFSKEAGRRRDLWGVEINGIRGYAPRNMLREKRVFHRELKHEVPTEYVAPENISKDHENGEKSPQVPTIIDAKSGIVTPIPPVSPSFEVIDGTTIDYSIDNQSPEDESYATKIRYSSSMEQPILSVHPNVASSELTINDDKLGGTDGLDGEVDEEKNKLDEVEVEDDGVEREDERIDEKSEEELIGEASPPSNIIEAPEKSEIVEDLSGKIDLGGGTEEKNEAVDEKNEGIEGKNEEVEEKNEEIEEKNKEIDGNSEIVSEEEPKEEGGVLSSAYQTVTSLFDSLTTPSPATVDENVEEEVGEVENEEEIPEKPILEENVDKIGEISTVLPDLTATLGENVAQSTEATSVIAEEELKEGEEKIEEVKEVESVFPEELVKIEEKIQGNQTEIVDVNEDDRVIGKSGQPGVYEDDGLSGSAKHVVNNILNFNEFPGNRNLLNVESGRQFNEKKAPINEDSTPAPLNPPPKFVDPPPPFKDSPPIPATEPPTASPSPMEPEIQTKSTVPPKEPAKTEDSTISDQIDAPDVKIIEQPPSTSAPLEVAKNETEVRIPTAQFCEADSDCSASEAENKKSEGEEEDEAFYDTAMMDVIYFGKNYWGTLSYAALTAFTTLVFSLGYYYIENRRRDGQFIAKINKLEKELLVATKECTALDETLKSTKNKLTSIEDESFGSNEMVASLKADLENANKSKAELEDQVASLEKDLEGATEAGLELERMLREILASNSAENPLAKSVEDLQTRLNAQQTANESLTNALQLKTQENETLSRDLAIMTQKCEQLEVEVTRITEELKEERELRRSNEGKLSGKVEELEKQLRDISAERINLRTQLRGKEMEMKDLLDLVKQDNKNNIDYEKLADISHVKAEASQLAEERDELRIKLSEVEGAHQLLEEHMKVINEEVASLSEQAKLAEKEKREAETRLEVLSNFFREKEAERQKEEAVWLQQQGEVSTTVERLQTMHNEILSYKQQIESLKREILDQEKEYKTQITGLEAKAHEQWVLARQNERRLEEAKAEAGQLRNRLTMVEKNFSDPESDVKIHRMETNGETTTPLFLGVEASSSPIMFSNTSGPPPPPPSYLYGPPLPPYMPPPLPPPGLPPYDVSQRPPPLGGRLASPPPMPPIPQNSGRYDNPGSPPPLSPPLIYGHRNFPPNPYGNERIPPPLPPWSANDDLLPSRNAGFHPFHRDQQRTRDHKGSLHSSGESLDKSHHSGKV